jgi:hypothetical protein
MEFIKDMNCVVHETGTDSSYIINTELSLEKLSVAKLHFGFVECFHNGS